MAKEKHRRCLKSYLCSRSSYRRQELCTGVATEHGKQPCNGNRNDASEKIVRSKVEMYKVVADEVVVVMKSVETWEERRASHNRF
jgi:O-succinylbenzoate synthase